MAGLLRRSGREHTAGTAGVTLWSQTPYADVLCEAGSGEEIVYADIDLARVDESRRAIPVGKLLRRDMYKVSD